MIDINDINYSYSHEELNLSFRKEKYTHGFQKICIHWGYILLQGFISSFSFLQRNYYSKTGKFDYIFLSFIGNDERALSPIAKKMGVSSKSFHLKDLPLRRTWFYAMIYSPIVFFKYLKYSGYLKKAYANEFMYFCRAYGYYIEAKKILKQLEAKFLIVANDHTYSRRAFFRAAQSLNIKTAYVQHASISENFPPLEYDYAFLDGQESLDKYMANDKLCLSKVFLTGSPRFDIIKEIKKNENENNNSKIRLGIAINMVDTLEKIQYLIDNIQKATNNIQITFRPHPAMDKYFWSNFAINNNCIYSASKVENPFDFISNNDIFIAGETSFHLDVALTGKTSYYYNFSNEDSLDHYGYLKNGLIKELSGNFTELNDTSIGIVNPREREELIQYYVANYETSDWGKSAELISKILECKE